MTGHIRSMNVQSGITKFEGLHSESAKGKIGPSSTIQDRLGSRSRKVTLGKSSSIGIHRHVTTETNEVKNSRTTSTYNFVVPQREALVPSAASLPSLPAVVATKIGNRRLVPKESHEVDKAKTPLKTNFSEAKGESVIATKPSPSVTTVASHNRINRLQKTSSSHTTSSTPSSSNADSQVSEHKVDSKPTNASANFKHIRNSSLSRKLLGLDEHNAEPSKVESKVCENPYRPSSVDSTKESTSLSSNSQLSQRSRSPLVIFDSRVSKLETASSTMPTNGYQRSSLMTSTTSRQPNAQREIATPSVKQFIHSPTPTNDSQNHVQHYQQNRYSRDSTASPFSTKRMDTRSLTQSTTSATSRLEKDSSSSDTTANRIKNESSTYDEGNTSKNVESKALSSTTSATRTITSSRAFHAGLARRRQKKNEDINGSGDTSHPIPGSKQEDSTRTSGQSRSSPVVNQRPASVSKSLPLHEKNKNEMHQTSRDTSSSLNDHSETSRPFDQNPAREQRLHRTQRLPSQAVSQGAAQQPLARMQPNSSYETGLSVNQHAPLPISIKKHEVLHQQPTIPVQQSQYSASPQGQISVQSRVEPHVAHQFPSSQGRKSPASNYQLPAIGSNSLPPYQNGRQSPTSSNLLDYSTRVGPHSSMNQSFSITKYPVPASPSQYASRPRTHSPALTQPKMLRYQVQLASSQEQLTAARSPNSHVLPSLSPAGIPVTSRLSLSPQDPGGAPQMSYHDDEITLTSVGQIVGTSMDRKSPDVSRHGSGLADNTAFVHSSSTTSDSNTNPSPLRRRIPSNVERTKEAARTHRLRVAQTSSSDYETDTNDSGDDNGSASLQEAVLKEPTMSALSASQLTSDMVNFFNRQNRIPVDDETYDYGDREDDSQGSLSYAQRRQKEQREKSARQAAVAAAKAEMDGPFMKTDDVDHYRKTLDTPLSRTALGIATAATVGCALLGPVGLLVGAAAVGIGVGYMQIPEEQRQNMNNKATEAFRNAQESTFTATEKLSNSCATTYKDSGISDHVPPEVQTCCSGLTLLDKDEREKGGKHPDTTVTSAIGEDKGESSGTLLNNRDFRNNFSPANLGRVRDKRGKVACLREGKYVPIHQIHALDPGMQPRAWLDILASVETTHDEKMEAIEEIIILAKDKQRARIFVEEGVLDCLLWTIGRYFEKKNYDPVGPVKWLNAEISREEEHGAKRAAMCCLALGKSYCAAMHTEGDLLLMSLYERGTVPEERQLAQMLFEVPHHARATVVEDPTIITSNEVFALKQLTLPQAEELSTRIKALAEGNKK